MPKGERAMLTAVAQYPDGADRTQLTVLTGYKRSTRDRLLQYLGAKGFVTPNGDLVTATEEGLAALGDFEPLPTGAALLNYWLEKLPQGERKLLEVIAGAYPSAIERSTIDDAAGYKRSTRDRIIQYLQARKLVSDAGKGKVIASAILFD
jgi:DNA-binding IclR family transcriptional regulator